MQSNEEKSRVQQLLLDMFSSVSPADVLAICEKNQWNAENCIDCLLTNDSSKDSKNNHGAIPKTVTKVSKSNYGYGFSSLEQEIINNIRANYRVMVIMRGAPGSGKSSLARSIVEQSIPNFDGFNWQDFIFSADDYFYDNKGRYEYKIEKLSEAHASNTKRVQQKALSGWSPIIVDNTNMQIWEMIPYIKISLQNNYIVEILEPRTPWKNSPEKLAAKNSHGVPRDKIRNMLNKYESAKISDIIRTIKDVNISGTVPQIRNFPPVQSVQKCKEKDSTFINLHHQKNQQNIKLNNITPEKNISEILIEAPKAQRNQFSKKATKSSETHLQINESSEEIKKSEEKLLAVLKENVNSLPQTAFNDLNEQTCVKNIFERHTVDCPNENQVFALLRRVYVNKSISGLWDLFLKCNGNIDWAVDILLKEDEICSANNIAPLENNDIKDNYKCNCSNVSLMSKPNEVSDNRNFEVNKNFQLLCSDTSQLYLQEEKRRVKEIIEKKIVFGEEHLKHIRRQNNLRFTPQVQPAQKLIDASTQTDIPVEGDIENEMIEINFDANIISQLDAFFQTETIENEGLTLRKNISTNVFLPKALAKELYMLCMESIYNQMEEERQKVVREDENFAKLIHNLEYENFKEPADTQDLGDLLVAFKFLGLDVENKNRLENVECPVNLATHLTLLKLSDEFPETPSETLLDIFKAQDNNYTETVKFLLVNNMEYDLGLPKQTLQNDVVTEKPVDSSTNISKKASLSREEAKRLALSKFEEARNLAVHHCQLKGECYQKAKEMVQKGNSAVAVYYSHIANMHKRKIEMYNQCAANSIVDVHKYSKNNPDLLDLHYLHVAEAMGCLDLFLDRHISSLRSTLRAYKNVFIITGRGLHSSGGISTIKNKVKNRLKDRNLRWNEVNPGLLKVKLFSTSRFSK